MKCYWELKVTLIKCFLCYLPYSEMSVCLSENLSSVAFMFCVLSRYTNTDTSFSSFYLHIPLFLPLWMWHIFLPSVKFLQAHAGWTKCETEGGDHISKCTQEEILYYQNTALYKNKWALYNGTAGTESNYRKDQCTVKYWVRMMGFPKVISELSLMHLNHAEFYSRDCLWNSF